VSSSGTFVSDVFVSSTLGLAGGSGDGGVCCCATELFSIGQATGNASKPMTVVEGSQDGDGGTLQVTCSVVPSGAGFDIQLSANDPWYTYLAGVPYGMQGLTISSPPGQGAVTTAGGAGIYATWQDPFGTYSDSNCTIAFTYGGQPLVVGPPVAPGRIWGHISCPSVIGGYGLGCSGEADFLFENCAQ
jgi:hypothetical protein